MNLDDLFVFVTLMGLAVAGLLSFRKLSPRISGAILNWKVRWKLAGPDADCPVLDILSHPKNWIYILYLIFLKLLNFFIVLGKPQ